jgi:hypothetical protein
MNIYVIAMFWCQSFMLTVIFVDLALQIPFSIRNLLYFLLCLSLFKCASRLQIDVFILFSQFISSISAVFFILVPWNICACCRHLRVAGNCVCVYCVRTPAHVLDVYVAAGFMQMQVE